LVSERDTKDGGSNDQKLLDGGTQKADDPELAELLDQLSETKGSKALRLIKRAIKRSPSSAALHELACEYLLAAGKHADAVKSCEKALSLSPSRSKARTLLQEAKQAREQATGEPSGDKGDKDKDSVGDANDGAPSSEPAPAAASTTSPKKPDAYNVDFLR
jgi:tetratricopeptide (TPR) repeat protein